MKTFPLVVASLASVLSATPALGMRRTRRVNNSSPTTPISTMAPVPLVSDPALLRPVFKPGRLLPGARTNAATRATAPGDVVVLDQVRAQPNNGALRENLQDLTQYGAFNLKLPEILAVRSWLAQNEPGFGSVGADTPRTASNGTGGDVFWLGDRVSIVGPKGPTTGLILGVRGGAGATATVDVLTVVDGQFRVQNDRYLSASETKIRGVMASGMTMDVRQYRGE
jgi:hypothetical protein